MPLQEPVLDHDVPGPRRRRWQDGGTPSLESDAPWSMADQWPVVVGALAGDQLQFLEAVDAHLRQATAAGRMDAAEALALRRAMANLRHTSLRAQQVTRLASGRIRQYRERLDLAQVVRAVLRDRPDGTALSKAVAQADLLPVDLRMDASLAYTLVEAVIAWMFARCRDIVIRTDPVARGNDDVATLLVTGRRLTAARGEGEPRRRRLEDGLDLVLARQAAEAAGLSMHLRQEGDLVGMGVHFPRAMTEPSGSMPGIEWPARAPVAHVPEWVLVITPDSGLVSSAAFGLGQAGFETRGAQTARDARRKLQDSPVAVILDETARGGEFESLRAELLAVVGPRPLIEIIRRRPEGPALVPRPGERPKVARDDVVPDIAATLLLELAKAS
jgi:hypothetical protein